MHSFEFLDVFLALRNVCSLPIITCPRKAINLNDSGCLTRLHYIQSISYSPFIPFLACDEDFNYLFLIKEKSRYFPIFLKHFGYLHFPSVVAVYTSHISICLDMYCILCHKHELIIKGNAAFCSLFLKFLF